MKKRIYATIVMPVLLFTFCSCNGRPGQDLAPENDMASSISSITAMPSGIPSSPDTESSIPEETGEKPVSINISFTGDCTFWALYAKAGTRSFPLVYQKSGSVTYPFDGVKGLFEKDDMTIINFEGTLTYETKKAPKKFHFKGPAEYADILKYASVEAAILSNNHSVDFYKKGFSDTVDNLTKADIAVVYEDNALIREINGVEVVIIGDCSITGENTTVTDGVVERVLAQIARYKKADNIVIVDMHWGSEYAPAPSDWQQTAAHAFVDEGADLVLGQHPHVIQGIEYYNGKYIAYSLGNFAFGGNTLAKYKETFILNAIFTVNAGQLTDTAVRIVPCYTTSSTEKDASGVALNNFQPMIVTGAEAEEIAELVLERSGMLEYGIETVSIVDDIVK